MLILMDTSENSAHRYPTLYTLLVVWQLVYPITEPLCSLCFPAPKHANTLACSSDALLADSSVASLVIHQGKGASTHSHAWHTHHVQHHMQPHTLNPIFFPLVHHSKTDYSEGSQIGCHLALWICSSVTPKCCLSFNNTFNKVSVGLCGYPHRVQTHKPSTPADFTGKREIALDG